MGSMPEADTKLELTPCPKCSKSNLKFSGPVRDTNRREYKARCTCGFEGWIGWTYDPDKQDKKATFSPALPAVESMPEIELDVESLKQFSIGDAKIKLIEAYGGAPVSPGTRSVHAHLFEVGADGIDPKLVKKVRLCISRNGFLSPLFILDYRIPHRLALPKCFAVGHSGMLGTTEAGEFKAEIISYVKKKGS